MAGYSSSSLQRHNITNANWMKMPHFLISVWNYHMCHVALTVFCYSQDDTGLNSLWNHKSVHVPSASVTSINFVQSSDAMRGNGSYSSLKKNSFSSGNMSECPRLIKFLWPCLFKCSKDLYQIFYEKKFKQMMPIDWKALICTWLQKH